MDDSSSILDGKPSGARSPKIPLPFNIGGLSAWLVFRVKFNTQVIQENLPNTVRFYYLLGCLKGGASQSIQNIVVSEDTFDLVWSTLVYRFEKPRPLTILIVDKIFFLFMHNPKSH